MTPIIQVQQVSHIYNPESERPVHALRDVSLTVTAGEYLVILGHNGSGKSTLAKHLNGLLAPTTGDVVVKGWNTKETNQLRDIRSTVGMVFQTPDNQIVATIVEEDVAFGPENLGVPREEMVERVNWSLEQVNMSEFRHRAPHLLSGGQKQRICIAGVLAMQPEVLVLDESTAMLDPMGRQEVIEVAQRLNREQGTTVIAITHFMQEAVAADRVIIMAEGQIVLEGTPRELFGQVDRLRELHLDIPPATEIALALQEQFSDFPTDVLSVEELVDAVRRYESREGVGKEEKGEIRRQGDKERERSRVGQGEPLISMRSLVHDYMRGTPLQVRALHDVDLEIRPGEIVGVIGHTGSGKSTAIQHMNALLRPHGGKVIVLGHDLSKRNLDVRELRRRVGLVFQFPEAQLFERYVGDDIAYGPRNLKLSREEIRERVRRAMTAVGLGFDEFKDRMTFSLSGGQMRRVALAGVLALEPEVLVLDEPTAGLDPAGREQLMDHIMGLHQQGTTLVMISHDMDQLARVCNRIYVLADGRTALEGTPGDIFVRVDYLRSLGLDIPMPTQLFAALNDATRVPLEETSDSTETVYTIEQAIAALSQRLSHTRNSRGKGQ